MRRRHTGYVLTILLEMLLAVGALHAKINSVEITYPTPGDETKHEKRKAWIILAPFEMTRPDGNPTITIRLYAAEGRVAQPADFEYYGKVEIPYSGGGVRVDSTEFVLKLGEALADVPMGFQSFYLTADDGDGETPPSNILTWYVIDDDFQRIDTPEILSVESPIDGTVVLRLAPLGYKDFPGYDYPISNPTIFFYAYRADGERTSYDDGFSFMSNYGDGVFNRYYSEKGVDLGDGVVQMTISGMPGGRTSLYLQLGLITADRELTRPSRIVVVDVKGNQPEGLHLFTIDMETPSAVADDPAAGDGIVLYPNPTSGMLRLRLPSIAGRAVVRIHDARGELVGERSEESAAGSLAVDVASLPVGSYTALVSVGGRTQAHRFTIVR